jgi:extradiol dioxygenase family protein
LLAPARPQRIHSPVDGHDVPVPHFGLILTVPAFRKEPAGNALEFKAFAGDSPVFGA